MKRILISCCLSILFIGIYISMVGSTYSLISSESRFGVNAGWDGDTCLDGSYFFACWKSPDPFILGCIRNCYIFKLDASVDAGFSYIRPGTIPWANHLQDDSGKFFINNSNYGMQQIDSFVLFCQEKGLTPIYIGWPRNPYSYTLNADSEYVYHDWSIQDSFSKEIEWYDYWYTLVERYDGDGQGHFTKWNQQIDEARLDGTPLIIKHWEITNEPNWHPHWWPGVGEDKTIINPAGDSQIVKVKYMDEYKLYLHVSIQAIRDADPEAIIIGPTVVDRENYRWEYLSNMMNRHYILYEDNVFWDLLLDSFDYIDPFGDTIRLPSPIYDLDVISLHIGNPMDSTFIRLDRLYNIWSILAPELIQKPIWITEFAKSAEESDPGNIDDSLDTYDPNRADLFKQYLTDFLNYDGGLNLEKALIYTMYSWRKESGSDTFNNKYRYESLLNSGRQPYATFDTLDSFISRNTPYVHLITPDSGEILHSGIPYLIRIDSIFDLENHSNQGGGGINPKGEGSEIGYDISIRIEVSYNSGKNYDLIDETVMWYNSNGMDSLNYPWNPPYIISDKCKIRVLAKDSDRLVGISTGDSYFSISSDWPYESEPYSLEWETSYTNSDWVKCNYIIETRKGNYVVAVLDGDEAGLFLLNNDGDIEHSVIYSRDFISEIFCVLEVPETGYIITGVDSSDDGVIAFVNQDFEEFCKVPTGPGMVRDIIQCDGDTFVAVGFINLLDESRSFISKYKITTDDIVKVNDNYSIFGKLYSVIEDESENCFVAVGNCTNKGSCLLTFNNDNMNLIDSFLYGYDPEYWEGAMDVVEDDSGNYIMVGKKDGSDTAVAFIRKVDNNGNVLIENYLDDDHNPHPLTKAYSVHINENGSIIVGGLGINKDINPEQDIGYVAEISSDSLKLISVSAPFTVFYTDSINRSELVCINKTSDGGYIASGRIMNTKTNPWISDMAICKYNYDGPMNPDNQSSGGSQLGINAFSVLCANSLFRDKSTIRFVLPRQCNVNIVVYNILGQRVRTLVNGERDPGAYEIFWDGTDQRGVSVSSGSYFLRFQAGDFQSTKSLTVIR